MREYQTRQPFSDPEVCTVQVFKMYVATSHLYMSVLLGCSLKLMNYVAVGMSDHAIVLYIVNTT